MERVYREFNFNEDIELMNLTYQMNRGNFMNYEETNESNNEENIKII